MKAAWKLEWRDAPLSCVQMAERRTAEMVSHFGRNIRSMRIETLAASIYLQGVEDAFTYYEKEITKPTVGNQDVVPLAMATGLLGSGGI